MSDPRHREARDFARNLRRYRSDAEYLLWFHLRAKKRRGCKFRRQQPLGPFIADFVCMSKRLVVELDGAQHAATGHRNYDAARTRWLESHGFRVLRFWNIELFDCIERVVAIIDDALDAIDSAK